MLSHATLVELYEDTIVYMREFTRICANMYEYARICANMYEYARICAICTNMYDMREYARMLTCQFRILYPPTIVQIKWGEVNLQIVS